MRLRRLTWFLAALGTAAGVSAAEPSFDVHLVEPAAGIDLAAGSTTSIAWQASGTPANVEEWEAFLSVDGGRTYPLRVTPHLDATIHRFQWNVPNLPGAQVAVLLRFGDENEERRFVFPARARIRGVASSLALFRDPEPIQADERGHDVDLGDEGATAWVEGSRDGSSLRHVVLHGKSMLSGRADLDIPRNDGSASALNGAGGDHSIRRGVAKLHVASNGFSRLPSRFESRRYVGDILLTSRRRNI